MKTIKLPLPAEERDLIGRINHSHPGEPGTPLRMADWLEMLRREKNIRLDLIAEAAELGKSTMRGLVAGRPIGLQGTLAIVHAVRRHNAGQINLSDWSTPPLLEVAKTHKKKSAVQHKSKNVPHGTKRKGGRP